MTCDAFFEKGIGKRPYDYQRRLASREGETSRVSSGTRPESRLISIPTGLGKTAAVVAWLWNRIHLRRSGWTHRLVFFEHLFRSADLRASQLATEPS